MKKFILNKRYQLRITRDRNCYTLNDNQELKEYKISYPLFFILNQFKCRPTALNELEKVYNDKNLNQQFNEFVNILKLKEFSDLLIEADTSYVESNNFYRNKKEISIFTEYSPERIDFFITKYCNLQCKHCFESSSYKLTKPQPVNIEMLRSLFDQMDYMNVKQIKITGGEALTIPNFKDIIEQSLNYRFQLMILTNGILLNDELIELLKKKNALVGLSLDGIDKESHEALRGKGSYNPLESNLFKLRKAQVTFSLTTTLNSINYTQIRDICTKGLNLYGAKNISFSFMYSLGRANENKYLALSLKNQKEAISEIDNLKEIHGNKTVMFTDDTALGELNDRKTIVCAAGTKVLAMDHEFNFYPCIYGVGLEKYLIGSLTNETLEDIWYSDKLNIFRGEVCLDDLPKCKICSFSSRCVIKNCRLKSVFEGGNFYDPVSFCYKNTRSITNNLI